MLNISKSSISSRIDTSKYTSFQLLSERNVSPVLLRLLLVLALLGFIALFMPWTQNIRTTGYVTTLFPEDRPQVVQSIIDGRIEQWRVGEGQLVSRGDTLVILSEASTSYIDPALVENTEGQLAAKRGAAGAYAQKADRLQSQYQTLINNIEIKLQQNELYREQELLKLRSDSLDLVAARVKVSNSKNQLQRTESLYNDGIKSLTDVEIKRLAVQEAQAAVLGYENSLETQRAKVKTLEANRASLRNEAMDKALKAQSDKQTALSQQYSAEADISKLNSDLGSYSQRRNNAVILSPIDGYITQALKSGIGEYVKSGEALVSVVPENFNKAVEAYVRPRDMPLLEVGQPTRILFDGWPAIVFRGWPENSYGTFAGEVYAIDNYISENGKYRILIAPAEDAEEWPHQVRVGGGANTLLLLKRVRVYYEIWRQLNGFPPDYYKKKQLKDTKAKPPLKRFK